VEKTKRMSTILTSEAESFIAEHYEDNDPTCANGFKSVFDREIIYKVDGKNVIYRTRILNLYVDNNQLSEVRFELFNDDDINFLYDSSLTANEYEQFQKENQLTIKFEGFGQSVQTLLENSVKNPKEYECKFTFSEDKETASIEFFQTLRLRKVEIFGLQFHRSEKEFIEAQAQYRFNKYKSELEKKKREYDEIIRKIEAKNPSIAKRIVDAVDKTIEKENQENCTASTIPKSPKTK